MPMKKDKKKYEDDDGRSIADMSGIDRPSLFIPRKHPTKGAEHDKSSGNDRPWENNSMTKKERRLYVFGALGAALLIGLVFAIGIGLIIWFMTVAWH